MRILKIAVAQSQPKYGDKEYNLSVIENQKPGNGYAIAPFAKN